jgi:hypothetical protein
MKTKALKGGAACPQAAALEAVDGQPLEDKRLHPFCIIPNKALDRCPAILCIL